MPNVANAIQHGVRPYRSRSERRKWSQAAGAVTHNAEINEPVSTARPGFAISAAGR